MPDVLDRLAEFANFLVGRLLTLELARRLPAGELRVL